MSSGWSGHLSLRVGDQVAVVVGVGAAVVVLEAVDVLGQIGAPVVEVGRRRRGRCRSRGSRPGPRSRRSPRPGRGRRPRRWGGRRGRCRKLPNQNDSDDEARDQAASSRRRSRDRPPRSQLLQADVVQIVVQQDVVTTAEAQAQRFAQPPLDAELRREGDVGLGELVVLRRRRCRSPGPWCPRARTCGPPWWRSRASWWRRRPGRGTA